MILGCHYSCRYNLTCMSYAHYAFKKFSFFKAIVKTVRRVLSCHPFSRKTDEDLE